MTTNRQLRTRKPQAVMTTHEFEGMLTGVFYFDDLPEARMRELWEDHSRELTDAWTHRHGLFSRCWAWWKNSAPEIRRRIGGEGFAAIDSDHCPEWAKKISFGRPVVWDADYGDEIESWFETEKDFLLRHPELLTETERLSIKKSSKKQIVVECSATVQ